MGVVTYSNFDGLVAETRSGAGRIYVPDTLGSTMEMTDNSGTTTDTFEYWSYGEEKSHVGTSPTRFTFLGILGYFKDVLNKLYYVRARTLRPDFGAWQTVDPLWPFQPSYQYVRSSPSQFVDPSGLIKLGALWKCLGGVGGALLGWWGEHFGGGGSGFNSNTLCKLGAGCIAGLADAITEGLVVGACPECEAFNVASCVSGAVASVINTVLGQVCNYLTKPCYKFPSGKELACDIAGAIVDAIAACLTGLFGSSGIGGIVGGIRGLVYGLIGGIVGSACEKADEETESPQPPLWKRLPGQYGRPPNFGYA